MSRPLNDQTMQDQQLPINLVRKLGGWGARAQTYPMFSPTWFRYKLLSFSVPLGIFACILIAFAVFASTSQKELPPVLFELELAWIWVNFSCLLIFGRWLATLVYRRHWSPKKEAIGVIASIVIGIVLTSTLNELGDYYVKYQKRIAPNEHPDVNLIITTTVEHKEQQNDDAKNKKDDQTDELGRETAAALGEVVWVALGIWLGGAMDLVAYFRQRRALRDALAQQELDEAKRRRNEAEMRLSVLAAQIEPHFLFNTLAGVRSAIRNDPARGITIIDHLVDYLRATIPQMRSEANTTTVLLESQLNAARAYLGVMHARLPRLSFSVDCAPDLLALPVPPLMLISLVENAVKHGIEPKPGAARIDVVARKISDDQGEYIELSVADDGIGFSNATSGSGIGLANIHERLAQLYGKKAQLSLKGRPQGGVIASIILPIEAAST